MFLHFVHSCLFIILRSEVPNTKAPQSGHGHWSTCIGWGSVWVSRQLLRERSSYATLCGQLCLPLPLGECVGLTSVAPGKVLICHTLWSVAPTPSPSKMRHVLMLACTCGGKKQQSESSQLWSLTFIRPLSFRGEQVITLHPKYKHFSLVT